jgi:hypothetical protein
MKTRLIHVCLVLMMPCSVLLTVLHAQTTRRQDRQAVLKQITDNLNTPLDATLKWLKNELSKYGTTNGSLYPMQLKGITFSRCKGSFSYRAMLPPDADAKYGAFHPEKEYNFNLADLDPHSISFSSFSNATRILVGTWDLEPKITIVTKNAVTGESFPGHQSMPVMSLDLAETKSGQQIRDALVHAIILCQPPPQP